MRSRKNLRQTANALLFGRNSAGFMPPTTWSQLSEALSTLANGSVRRDLIQAWVASTARNARWLPPEMTLALVLRAAIVIVGERTGLLHSGLSLVANLGALGRIALIVIASSAVALLFAISVFAVRLMMLLLQGTPAI